MKITQVKQSPKPVTITTNEIPEGQVFRGSIEGRPRRLHLKIQNARNEGGKPYVLDLEGRLSGRLAFGLYAHCVKVDDYEPCSDVELIVRD